MIFHDWLKNVFNFVCPTLNQNWAYGHSSGSSWSWGSSRSLWTLLLQQNIYVMFSCFHFLHCILLIITFCTVMKQINFTTFTHRLSSVSLFSGLADWTRSTGSAWGTRWSCRTSVTPITLKQNNKKVCHIRESTIQYGTLWLASCMRLHICSLCFQPWLQ